MKYSFIKIWLLAFVCFIAMWTPTAYYFGLPFKPFAIIFSGLFIGFYFAGLLWLADKSRDLKRKMYK